MSMSKKVIISYQFYVDPVFYAEIQMYVNTPFFTE